MALLKRNTTLWLLRTVGALLIALAASAGITGQAFAHDDDDDHEVVTYGPNACRVVADLPAYPGATCVKHKTEQDDGQTETKNNYVTSDAADAVRRSFEAAFRAHGWTLIETEYDAEDLEWEYTVTKGVRRVEVKVEAQEPHEGTGTEIAIEEG